MSMCDAYALLLYLVCTAIIVANCSASNVLADKLYKVLLDDRKYSALVRPVHYNNESLTVFFGLRLAQLIDVDEINQILTTSVWVEHEWIDEHFQWEPNDYDGIEMLYVPAEKLWRPDIVLYNNADGNYQITIMTKAAVYFNGTIKWIPPAVYKSSCQINVEFFPFDLQECTLKFGSWTYDGYKVNLLHVIQKRTQDVHPHCHVVINYAIDLNYFYESVEWDIFNLSAKRQDSFFSCCSQPYADISFTVTLCRKTLFYAINLIIPCIAISFLTVLVFFLPSDSGQKISLSISILLSMTVFFLLLAEIIPPTSLVVPLIGKYLLFTMVLVSLSIIVTVVVLNNHFRHDGMHTISPWLKKLFFGILPKLLFMRSPDNMANPRNQQSGLPAISGENDGGHCRNSREWESGQIRTSLVQAARAAHYIALHVKEDQMNTSIREDWKYIGMVLDRLFLYIFTISCTIGCLGIILQAPAIYDNRTPLTSENVPNLTQLTVMPTTNVCKDRSMLRVPLM